MTIACLAALTALEVLWELLLAPTHRWLALKALPLAVLLPGVARGLAKSRQWLALLAPWYAAEALVRALTEPGRHAIVAAVTTALAIATFASVLAWFRAERRYATN